MEPLHEKCRALKPLRSINLPSTILCVTLVMSITFTYLRNPLESVISLALRRPTYLKKIKLIFTKVYTHVKKHRMVGRSKVLVKKFKEWPGKCTLIKEPEEGSGKQCLQLITDHLRGEKLLGDIVMWGQLVLMRADLVAWEGWESNWGLLCEQ